VVIRGRSKLHPILQLWHKDTIKDHPTTTKIKRQICLLIFEQFVEPFCHQLGDFRQSIAPPDADRVQTAPNFGTKTPLRTTKKRQKSKGKFAF
jgi:hypothetical protein